MFLFFIEVLEFNSFDFSLNTKKNISIRADSENAINNFNNDISIDYEETENEDDKIKSLGEILSSNKENENKEIFD